MKINILTVSIGRTERHAKYFMSSPTITLSASLDPDDDLREMFEEMADDVREMVAETILKEEQIHAERHRKDKLESNSCRNEES